MARRVQHSTSFQLYYMLIDYCNYLHVYLYCSIQILYSVIASNSLLKHVFYHYYMLSYHCQCMSHRTPGHVVCVLSVCVECVLSVCWMCVECVLSVCCVCGVINYESETQWKKWKMEKYTKPIMEKGVSWLHLLPFKVITHLYSLWP